MKLEELLIFGGRRLPVLLQAEASECGLACLGMVAGWHGYRADLGLLRASYPTSLKGVALDGLMRTAERMHFSSRPLRLELEELPELQLPCILHWDMKHFVVLAEVKRRRAKIHDPAFGVRWMPLDELSQHFTGVALELTPTPDFESRDERRRVRLYDFFRRMTGFKTGLLQLFLLSLVMQLFGLASPFYMQLVVDEAITGRDAELLEVLALGFLLLMLIGLVLSVLRTWLGVLFGTRLGFRLRVNLVHHLLRLPQVWFERRHMGDVLSRIGSAEPVQQMLTGGAIAAALDGIFVVIVLVMMFLYSPTLTWITIGAFVLYSLVRVLSYGLFRELNLQSIVEGAKESSLFMENIRAIQGVRAFGRTAAREAAWHNQYVRVTNIGIRLQRYSLVFSVANGLLFGLENIAVVYLGAQLVFDSVFTVGMLFAFISYKGQFSGRAGALIDQAVALKMLDLHRERLADLVHEPTEVPGSVQDGLRGALQGRVAFENLGFRYAETEPFVYRNLNGVIEVGESVVIAGPSGCGKTTLIKLLLGILQPSEGKVRIDGIELSPNWLPELRRQIAVVMQDDMLLSGSLLDNISFFDREVDAGRVAECARLAQIHDEITAMPMAFQTLVGDMGTALSGGQRQRVLLARALYHQPRILVLDEATSQVDVACEERIDSALKALAITRVIVAHRPDTIARADRVLSLTAAVP